MNSLGLQARTFQPACRPVWEAMWKSGDGEGLCEAGRAADGGYEEPLRALKNEKPSEDFASLV